MKFYSTQDKSLRATLKEAVITGMPADGGLYMPLSIPKLSEAFIQSLEGKGLQEIGFEIARLFIDNINENELHNIINSALNFDTPLININDHIHTLETFHGPTLAFKDIGARFMARLMSYLIRGEDRKLNIIVATSGDTGSAVANGFYKVPGIRVFVLYPCGKISKIQEKQIATLGENITAIEVKGNFDDCQELVKTALGDQKLNQKIELTTANSINIARLLPQIFYYFRAFAQLENFMDSDIIVSVPCGNFGNLTAGLFAQRMGLPVQKFIAATNINKVVPEYLQSGQYQPRESIATISNAMDVGDPSNFARILDFYDNDREAILEDISGASYNDTETRQTIKKVLSRWGYICDPHGAVGFRALEEYLMQVDPGASGIFLETAHPAKFKDVVEEEIGIEVSVPERLAKFLKREKLSLKIEKDYQKVKDILLDQ
ncbi:MAG TPA: threonine synthase [bacterium]|nr:threonine synthase [bacterium]